MKQRSTVASLTAIAFVLASCAPSLPSPEVSSTAIEAEATRLASLSPGAGHREDPDLELGRRDLVQALHRLKDAAEHYCAADPSDCRFTLRLSSSDDLNASIDDEQRIRFTRPLLQLCGSIDEAAFILAHEMAHGIQDHVPKTQTRAQVGSFLLQGTLIALGAFAGFSPSASDLRAVSDIGADMASRVYSQAEELEADHLAYRITAAAGYDPEAGVRLFERMALEDGQHGASVAWMATHPSFAERIATLKAIAAAEDPEATPETSAELARDGGSG